MGQDGEDPAMIVGRRQELELREDVGDVGFDRLRSEDERITDRLVRAALGHQGKDVALALGQIVERDPGAPPADELGDDLRVDHGAAARDPPDRVKAACMFSPSPGELERSALVALVAPGCRRGWSTLRHTERASQPDESWHRRRSDPRARHWTVRRGPGATCPQRNESDARREYLGEDAHQRTIH